MNKFIASIVIGSLHLVLACSNNSPTLGDGKTEEACKKPGESCAGVAQGETCMTTADVVCCSGAWTAGMNCPASPVDCSSSGLCSSSTALCTGYACCGGNVVANSCPTTSNPIPNPGPTTDGGIVQNPGPSPTQPPVDGTASWCGSSYRTIRVVWPGIPANGFTTRRGAWASPVIKGATGVGTDFRAWPSQTPANNLDTWLEQDRNVTYSTASFVEDIKVCTVHSVMVSLFDNHTDGRPTYSPTSNCDATTEFYEHGARVTPRCVQNNARDGWNYIVD